MVSEKSVISKVICSNFVAGVSGYNKHIVLFTSLVGYFRHGRD